jgi:hypothetical protein
LGLLKAGVKAALAVFYGYDLDPGALGQLLLHFVLTQWHVLTVDRTEWQFGRAPVNGLVVDGVFIEVTRPIAWTALPKVGDS